MAFPLFVPFERRQRHYKTRRTLEKLSDSEVRQHCGLPIWGARDLIELYEPVSGITASSIPLDTKVLTFLAQLRSGSFQWIVGGDCGISQPSASRIIQSCCDHTLTFAPSIINFPSTVAELNQIKQRFYDIARIPNIIGAVDGTHIPILSPSEQEPVYVNRKQYHSINVQVVASRDYQIFDAVAKWPGSTHDSYIWRESSIRDRLYNGEFGHSFFLGEGNGCNLQKQL